MATAIHPKNEFPANSLRKGTGLLAWVRRVTSTAVGAKQLMALTGLALTLFVIGHLAGNLKLYAGQDSINAYAEFLKSTGPLLWVARGGLLAVFVLHLSLAIWLKYRSKLARPVPYAYASTVQASYASRTMLLTGLAVGSFVLFHLAHYTLGVAVGAQVTGISETVNYLDLTDAQGRHDVYSMAVYGFQNEVISAAYILAMCVLFFHLLHGVKSAFQSLGLNTPRWERFWNGAAWAVALFVVVGNISIPAMILAGEIQPNPDLSNTLKAIGQ